MHNEPGPQFPPFTELGRQRKVYRYRDEVRVDILPPAGLLVGLAATVWFISNPSGFISVLPLTIPVTLLLLASAFALDRHYRSQSFAIYDGGLAIAGKHGLRQVRWEEIAWLDNKGDDPEVEPLDLFIHTVQGEAIGIPRVYEGSNELWAAIKSGVHRAQAHRRRPRHVPGMDKRYAR